MWFDDSNAEAKLLSFLDEQTDSPSGVVVLNRDETSFLDLGCGNGSLLFALRDDGWRGTMLGVDYSAQSVALAKQIDQKRREKGEEEEDHSGHNSGEEIDFAEWDVLLGAFTTAIRGPKGEGWDVVLDKGTFDAICLSEERDATGRRVCEGYPGRVLQLMKPGGFFLVTSCNWTEAELKAWFEGAVEGEEGGFVQAGRVRYPAFVFGGKEGQTISSLWFRKRAPEMLGPDS